jgi:cardiolipin synthase
VVGSINFDYRSLYLHMENAVWMYGEDMAKKVRDDFLALQEVSTSATGNEVGRLSLIGKVWRSILRALSPLF